MNNNYNKNDILDIIKSIGKRKWKKTLSNIKVVTDHYKYCIDYNLEKFICFDLSTHNWMMNYFGCSKSSSKIISFCREIGLVECIDELFHYFFLSNGYFCRDRSYCKKYNYNLKVHKILLELYKEYDIHTTKKVEEENILNPEYFEALISNQSYNNNKDLDISSNLVNQMNSKYLTKKEVILIVNRNNNNLLKDCQQMIRDINSYGHSYINLRLNVNIERDESNVVTKISTRLYSNACNKASHNIEDKHKNNNIYTYLDSIGMKDPIKFDINASIHRLSLLLSSELEANDYSDYNLNTKYFSQYTVDDIYTQLFDKISIMNNNIKDISDISRDLKKLLTNRLYFWRYKYDGLSKFHKFLMKDNISKDYIRIKNIPNVHTIIDLLDSLYTSYGSKIFLVESYVMLHTMLYILDQYYYHTHNTTDCKMAVVYDCIYLSKNIVDELKIDNVKFHNIISFGVRKFLEKKYFNNTVRDVNEESKFLIKELLV